MRNFSKYLIGLATLSMVSCADWYTTHQLPEPGTAITTQEVFTYTLSDKDYDTISRNPASLVNRPLRDPLWYASHPSV